VAIRDRNVRRSESGARVKVDSSNKMVYPRAILTFKPIVKTRIARTLKLINSFRKTSRRRASRTWKRCSKSSWKRTRKRSAR